LADLSRESSKLRKFLNDIRSPKRQDIQRERIFFEYLGAKEGWLRRRSFIMARFVKIVTSSRLLRKYPEGPAGGEKAA